jgi:hypothetical protein
MYFISYLIVVRCLSFYSILVSISHKNPFTSSMKKISLLCQESYRSISAVPRMICRLITSAFCISHSALLSPYILHCVHRFSKIHMRPQSCVGNHLGCRVMILCYTFLSLPFTLRVLFSFSCKPV